MPGDFSSAAPFIVAATRCQGSKLTLRGIGINPTRTGLLAVMERMGGRVGLFRRRFVRRRAGGRHRGAAGRAGGRRDVTAEQVPSLIDELPLLVLLASFAHGVTTIRGAGELRVKESDRIATVVDALNAVGAHVNALGRRLRDARRAPRLRGGDIDAAGDHRIAMLGAVAGACSQSGVTIEGAEALGVSFPDFAERLAAVSE